MPGSSVPVLLGSRAFETSKVFQIGAEVTQVTNDTGIRSMKSKDAKFIGEAVRGRSSSIADQIEETAGVWLAAVCTVIAGVGTVLQLIAWFR